MSSVDLLAKQWDYEENQLKGSDKETDSESPQDGNAEQELKVYKSPIINFIMKPVQKMQVFLCAGSIAGSCAACLIALIGSGVVAVPQAFYYSGFYWSTIQFLFCSVLGYCSNMFLIDSSIITGGKTYLQIGKKTCSPTIQYVIKISFFLCNWGYLIAYLVLENKMAAYAMEYFFGDSCPYFLRDPKGYFWAPLILIVISIPMCLQRTLKALRYFFVFGVLCQMYLITIVFTEPFTERFGKLSALYNEGRKFKVGGILNTFNTATYAYFVQMNILDIFWELKHPTRKNMNKVVTISMISAAVCYTLIGWTGYLTFTGSTNNLIGNDNGQDGIILLADYKHAGEVIACILLYLFAMIMSFPTCSKPTKDSFIDIIKPELEGGKDPKWMHYSIVIGCNLTGLVAALFIPSMHDVVEVMGGTLSPLICYGFPALFIIKAKPELSLGLKCLYVGFFICFMFFFGLFCTINNFANFTKGISD